MRHASIFALASSLVVALSGCSADSTPAEDGSAADEVRTASCPTTFKLDLAKPAVYKNTPTRYYDGSALSDGEKQRVADRMAEARKFGKSALSFELESKASGKCNYVSALSKAPTAPRAQLRGTSAKPMLDVVFGNYHYYAFPKTYGAEGFTFEAKARAGVFAQVSASGAFSDGASLIVKIGSAVIANAPVVEPPPGPDAIGEAVSDLTSDAVLPGPGRHDDQRVSGGTPLALVKSYIKAKYADDPEMAEGYELRSEAPAMLADEQVAGTLTKAVALRDSLETVGLWYQDWEETAAAKKARLDRVKAAIEKAAAAGAVFGFDGYEQNGCAAPTSYLLVLDPKNQRGYGIDLNPCEE